MLFAQQLPPVPYGGERTTSHSSGADDLNNSLQSVHSLPAMPPNPARRYGALGAMHVPPAQQQPSIPHSIPQGLGEDARYDVDASTRPAPVLPHSPARSVASTAHSDAGSVVPRQPPVRAGAAAPQTQAQGAVSHMSAAYAGQQQSGQNMEWMATRAPAASSQHVSAVPPPVPPHGMSVTVLDALLSYTQSCASTVQQAAQQSGILAQDTMAEHERGLLRYGNTVMLRSADPSGGFVMAPQADVDSLFGGTTSASTVRAVASGSGIGVARNGYLISHAVHGSSMAGLPVRSGDPILLRHVSLQRMLSVLPPEAPTAHGQGVGYPSYASTEARSVGLRDAGGYVHGGATPDEAWMIVSPDALLTAVRVLQAGPEQGGHGARRALPRPYLHSSQHVLLLSLAGGSSITHRSEGIVSQPAAREAVLRLHCLQCSSAASAANPSSLLFIDGLSSRLAAAAAQHARGGAAGNAGSLSPASLAVALAVQPPAGTLWSLHVVDGVPVSGSQHASGYGLGSTSLHDMATVCQPDGMLTRPALIGTHLLPSLVRPSSHGPAGVSLKSRAAPSLPIDLATRLRGKAEAGRAQGVLSETQVLEHVLDALLGSPGALISAHVPAVDSPAGAETVPWDTACSPPLLGALLADVAFHINEPRNVQRTGVQCDPSMAALVLRMLPLARHYIRCRWWVERRSRYGQGLVANAVAAAVHGLLKEYMQLVVQLERLLHHPAPGQPALTLAQTWYFLQPSLRTLSSLDLLLRSPGNEGSGGIGAQYAVGGQLVNVLLSFYNNTGDDLVRTLSSYLIEKGSVPLLAMLDAWLYNGTVHDPYQEFFIAEGTRMVLEDAQVVTSDDEAKALPAEVILGPESAGKATTKWSWEARFRVRGEGYTPFFLAPHAHDILMAGKYACALAECRAAAQDKALSLAAKRAGVAAAITSWGGHLDSTGSIMGVHKGEVGEGQDRAASAALSAYASPTKLLRVPSAILGADVPVPQPTRAMGGTGQGAGGPYSRRTSHAGSMGAMGPASPTGVTGSVLDTVFETRKQSIAASSSYPGAAFADMPAAGLPTSNAPGAMGPGGAKLVPASPSQAGHRDSASSPGGASPSGSGRRRPAAPPGVSYPAPTYNPDVHSAPADIGPARLPMPHAARAPFSMDAGAYGPVVDRAYTFAARSLLQYFLFASDSSGIGSVESSGGSGSEQGEGAWETEDMTHGLHPTARKLLSQGPSEDMTRLLRLAGGGADLLGRLNTLKCFFLLCTGDWLAAFLEAADGEFEKPAVAADAQSAVSSVRLQHHFESSIRSSIASGDPYVDMVKPTLAPCSLLAHIHALLDAGILEGGEGVPAPMHPVASLKGRDVFCLDMSVPWPASLVLTRASMAKYQILFRHLCCLTHAQKVVERCWASQQGCKALDLRATLAQSNLLRHRMLSFLASVSYYLTVEVIEPLWVALMAALQEAKTVDDVRTAHGDFLDSCLAHSLLTSPDLLKILTKLQSLCMIFAHQITTAIEKHRLSEHELDRRAGANRASLREKEAAEKGQFYSQDVLGEQEEEEWSRGMGGKGGGRRQSQGLSVTGASTGGKRSAAAVERERRKARIAVQADAMRHTLAQAGWQALLAKSTHIFDTLLTEFMTSLKDRTRADSSSHLVHLLSRLDLNGFYSVSGGMT